MTLPTLGRSIGVVPGPRLAEPLNGDTSSVQKLTYWLVVMALTVITIAALAFTATHGWTGAGVIGLFVSLASLAVLLSYSLSMRGRRSHPIAR